GEGQAQLHALLGVRIVVGVLLEAGRLLELGVDIRELVTLFLGERTGAAREMVSLAEPLDGIAQLRARGASDHGIEATRSDELLLDVPLPQCLHEIRADALRRLRQGGRGEEKRECKSETGQADG